MRRLTLSRLQTNARLSEALFAGLGRSQLSWPHQGTLAFLSQLATELESVDLRSECAAFSRFSDRVAKLERIVASWLAFGRRSEEPFLSPYRRLENLQSH
jgi:hypothetical protein